MLPCVPPLGALYSCIDFYAAFKLNRLYRSCRRGAATVLATVILLGGMAAAQIMDSKPAPVRDLITKPIDDAQRTELRGNRYPLARAEFDRGAAPASLPMRRMLLVLKRSDEQETALKVFLAGQQTKGSAHYHQWLTPEQFGEQFGPSANDVEKVKTWLTAHGFQVSGVAKGRTAVEFSGTAGQVQEAFRTTIHSYQVKGEQHWANASEPSIPLGLSPVVKGVLTLHNFPRHSGAVIHGQQVKSTQETASSYFTFTSGQKSYYGLGPTDFATIYDVLPLWQAGIDGTGQTIAIVGETNINTGDVDAFRSLFGLPQNTPKVILNGPDPGIIGDETEALLDVSWSGAVAKNATIEFVASASTETSLGVDLSALYIVDNDLAPVMSESYGICEQALGSAGNAFYNALWQQAAAEGITVVVATGDAGSAVCDNFNSQSYAVNGLAVSGFASTPYNVAVGGTDFDQSESTFANYWNPVNDPMTQSSAKSYIPETTWNQSCADAGTNGCGPDATNLEIVAGSGGPSSCSTQDNGSMCVSGYAKPVWQTGPGVLQDGVRDLPDVSLFASSGFNGSFYIICEADFSPFGPTPGYNEPCSLTNPNFVSLGGTSASAPAFAGIMALVNQRMNARQGNANYTLYNLAAQSGASCDASQTASSPNACLFHDITKGNISVPCAAGTPNCGPAPDNGYGVLVDPQNTGEPAWGTTSGYDLATGLGSVDAYNLVNAWGSTSMSASTTVLSSLDPANLVHGQTVNVSVTVAAESGSGTPTGSVALMASPAGQSLGIDTFALNNGVASGATSLLPGGTYNVTAHYSGDGIFGASDSAPMQVTVSKENSLIGATLATADFFNGGFAYGNTVPYGSIAFLRSDVTGEAGTSCAPNPQQARVACPTGTVNLTSGGKSVDAGSYALNSLGYAEDQEFALDLIGIGTYAVQAQYSGDGSYNASQTSLNAVVTQAPTFIYFVQIPDLTPDATGLNYTAMSGQAFHVVSTVSTRSVLNAPTGVITFQQNGAAPAGTAATTPMNGSFGGGFSGLNFAYLSSSLATSIDTPGPYTFTSSYRGDTNYLGSQSSFPITLTVQDTTFLISGTIANITLKAGNTGKAAVDFAGVDNFAGQIQVACSLPATMKEATCSASTASLVNGSSSNSTVTIVTTGPHLLAENIKPALGDGAFAIAAGLVFFAFGGRRRRLFLTMALLALVGVAMQGCGGGGKGTGGGGGGNKDPGTPTGTYTVSVTATSNNITRMASFTVTVQ